MAQPLHAVLFDDYQYKILHYNIHLSAVLNPLFITHTAPDGLQQNSERG